MSRHETLERGEQPLALSAQQKEIWINQSLHPDVALFNVGGHVRIAGKIDLNIFDQALNHVIGMHDALRIRLHEGEAFPFQTVAERRVIKLEERDFTGREQDALDWMQHEHRRALPLYDSFLCDFALCRVSDECYYWYCKYHYLVADGKTLALIVKDAADSYNALIAREPLPDAPPGYRRYLDQDRRYRFSPRFEEDSRYWRRQYKDLPKPLLQPQHAADFDAGETVPSGRCTLVLPRSLFRQIEAFAETQGASLRTFFLSLLHAYFLRIQRQDDFVIGATNLSHREADGEDALPFSQTAGFFINITPVRCAAGGQQSFAGLLKAMEAQCREDGRRALFPIGEINRQAGITQQSRNRSQLFELELAYIDYDCDVNFAGIPARFGFLSHGFEQYALTVYVARFHEDGDVPVYFDYNLGFFNREEMDLLAARFEHLLRQVLERPDVPLPELEAMPDAERDKLLRQFNATRRPYSDNRCIHQLFEAQAGSTPDAAAVVFAAQSLSYAQLNRSANRLAHRLLELGVGADVPVGICVERSPEMVVGLLAILKAGGAYVPLDPDYPSNRLAFMLQDAQVSVLLTQEKLLNLLPDKPEHVVCMDQDWQGGRTLSDANPDAGATPNHLAYVIYTSGSTGNPKGVLLEHGGLCNLVEDHIRCFGIGPHSRVLQFVSLSFDVASADIFMSLCAGAALCLAPPANKALEAGLAGIIRQLSVTHMQLPAPVLAALPADEVLPYLQVVATGGEAPNAAMIKHWSKGRRYFNVYGPTEATVCSSMAECDVTANKPTIGTPISNTRLYILDEFLRPLPIGVAGELYIGGKGLARGYLNRPELTAEKFVSVTVQAGSSERLYKTGDLARFLPDGNVEFLGRIDQQVKMRGFRIELGEIEAALGRHPSVKDCAVVLHESEAQGKYLSAYLVLQAEAQCDGAIFRVFLKNRLPDYMMPAAFNIVDALPLTPNGKVDRQELAQRNTDFQKSSDYAAPQTPEQQLLADCWAEILGLERIGIHDNFFEFGGDSLNGMRLVTLLQKKLNLSVQLAALFRYPTIAEFSILLENRSGAVIQPIVAREGIGPAPLSFSQEEVWRQNKRSPGDTSYNMVNGFRLKGRLQADVLRQCFAAIIQRHTLLRTRFVESGGTPLQLIDEKAVPILTQEDLSSRPEPQQEQAIKKCLSAQESLAFDLERAPLWRVSLLKLDDESHVLILCFHHIIEDAWSIQVLLHELTVLYSAFVACKPSPLEPLAIQYSDFAEWQRRYFTPDVLQRRHAYWREMLEDRPAPLDLPVDRPWTPAQTRQTYRSGSVSFEIPPSLTQRLRELGRSRGSTLSVLLLAAYAGLLRTVCNQDDLLMGAPMSKRNQHQVEPLIGYFSGMSILRIRLEQDLPFVKALDSVQTAMQSAMENQDLTMKQVWQGLQLPWTGEQQMTFRTVFNYIPVPRQAIRLPGLTLTPMSLNREKMVRDLAVGLWDKDGSGAAVEGFFRYRQDLFEADTVRALAEGYLDLLTAVADNPDHPIDTLSNRTWRIGNEHVNNAGSSCHG